MMFLAIALAVLSHPQLLNDGRIISPRLEGTPCLPCELLVLDPSTALSSAVQPALQANLPLISLHLLFIIIIAVISAVTLYFSPTFLHHFITQQPREMRAATGQQRLVDTVLTSPHKLCNRTASRGYATASPTPAYRPARRVPTSGCPRRKPLSDIFGPVVDAPVVTKQERRLYEYQEEAICFETRPAGSAHDKLSTRNLFRSEKVPNTISPRRAVFPSVAMRNDPSIRLPGKFKPSPCRQDRKCQAELQSRNSDRLIQKLESTIHDYSTKLKDTRVLMQRAQSTHVSEVSILKKAARVAQEELMTVKSQLACAMALSEDRRRMIAEMAAELQECSPKAKLLEIQLKDAMIELKEVSEELSEAKQKLYASRVAESQQTLQSAREISRLEYDIEVSRGAFAQRNRVLEKEIANLKRKLIVQAAHTHDVGPSKKDASSAVLSTSPPSGVFALDPIIEQE